MTDTTKKVLNEFKTNIVPAIFKKSCKVMLSDFNDTIKVSSLFGEYISGLEERKIITQKESNDLDLEWVVLLQKQFK